MKDLLKLLRAPEPRGALALKRPWDGRIDIRAFELPKKAGDGS